MLEAVWIGFAFVVGLFARSIGLPTLVGYLATGFVIAAASPFLALPDNGQGIIQHVAHLGVLVVCGVCPIECVSAPNLRQIKRFSY